MTARPKPFPVSTQPRIPFVVHDRAESRRFYGGEWHADYASVHPCGVVRSDVTLQPRVTNWNPATGSFLPAMVTNCPGCLAERERHAAACRAVLR